ncbi:MAG: hypothetical protein OXE94_04215 [Aestuariivita sp.]|nr:hypothetical protein [Aestuariivita sp.]MCY4202235.1 hypothetical protein [Aestuariivita sp.]
MMRVLNAIILHTVGNAGHGRIDKVRTTLAKAEDYLLKTVIGRLYHILLVG